MHSSARGQALTITTLLFSSIITMITLGITSPTIRGFQSGSDFQISKQAFYTAEAGSEDAYYRIRNNLATSFPETLMLDGATAVVTVIPTGSNEEEVDSTANYNNLERKVAKNLTVSDGFSFNFGVQTGLGGFFLNNGAVVNGNIYSSGVVTSSNNSVNSYNMIYGSVVSAGPNGSVDHIHATSSVYSHYIDHATIDGNAYYQSFNAATNTVTVAGTKYPNSADQATSTFPISDTLISTWETTAASGGSVTCNAGTYTISSNVTIGPRKIPCNLVISGNGTTVSLAGALWVTGNITINGSGGTGVVMKVDNSVGNKTVAVIADNPSDQINSSIITTSNNSTFYGSTGNANSYVMLLSQNKSAEQGGNVIAMDLINGAGGDVLMYASHGQIKLQNNVSLREVTSYKLTLINNTVVNYSVGLAQPLFTSGPGGAWKIQRWQEI